MVHQHIMRLPDKKILMEIPMGIPNPYTITGKPLESMGIPMVSSEH